jgi:hypothetical protein
MLCSGSGIIPCVLTSLCAMTMTVSCCGEMLLLDELFLRYVWFVFFFSALTLFQVQLACGSKLALCTHAY